MSEDQIVDRQKKARKESLKRKFKSRLPYILRLFLLAFVVVTLYLIFTETSIFNVQEIEVVGLDDNSIQFTDDKEIKEKLNSIYLDANFFTIDTTDVRTLVVNDFPFVKEAFVEKIFPVGLLISIVERVPYMTVQYGDECYLIDSEDSTIFDLHSIVEEAEEVVKCENYNEEYGTVFVTISKNDYDTIFTDQKGFFLYKQVYQANEMLREIGFTPTSYIVLERELQIRDENGRTLIFDPFGEFESQLMRSVLVFNQGSGIEDFRVIDFRYERPVLRE